ncbi:alpha-ketoglutarate-dependent dioxygenase AlkB [Alkalicaulis satelles]|uniref:Alpha-ketoglutarate-dependent dioxygenase AlkB n=1 Tax=Alkalicaulis satelles TaxID=2609175 RepID=A0A5M6ZID3_9PROT|nr:alpha-ketoglutarate-dependent dioxygenase AlkB [Alkalicaulis satelles]KAA5803795.1 alpha-ketoglutarate-dependent dioxygenase AlkB [Alkalicaulis satelles]
MAAEAGAQTDRPRFQTPDGFRLLPGFLGPDEQRKLADDVIAAIAHAPLYRPSMPRTGASLSVEMTNLGPLGWISDRGGYRYEPAHPVTGRPWPPMPDALLALWAAVSDWPDPPQACLVNVYGADSRLGLHVDADEDARDAPVVSVSLGDRARFRIGGLRRTDPTRSLVLSSGDVVVLGGAARRCHHGVDRIYPASSALLPEAWRPGRINLTLRRVR